MAGQARFTFSPIDLLPLLTQRAVAQLGSALVWGTRGRGFKSRQPDWDRGGSCADVPPLVPPERGLK